jgi:hypothetical protein
MTLTSRATLALVHQPLDRCDDRARVADIRVLLEGARAPGGVAPPPPPEVASPDNGGLLRREDRDAGATKVLR